MFDHGIHEVERPGAGADRERAGQDKSGEAPERVSENNLDQERERETAEKLDSATAEPRSYVEERADYKQAESIQREFEAATEKFATEPEAAVLGAGEVGAARQGPAAGQTGETGGITQPQGGGELIPERGMRESLGAGATDSGSGSLAEDEDDSGEPRAMAIDYGQPASLGTTPLGNDELPGQDGGGLTESVRLGMVIPPKEAIDGALAAEDAAAAMGIPSDPGEIYDRATGEPGAPYTPAGPEEVGGYQGPEEVDAYEGPEEIGVVEETTEADLGGQIGVPDEVLEAMPSDAAGMKFPHEGLAEYEGSGPGPGGTTELGADELEGEPIGEAPVQSVDGQEAVLQEEAAAASGQGPSNPDTISEMATGTQAVGQRTWIGVEGEDSSGLSGGPEEVGPDEERAPVTGSAAIPGGTEDVIDIQSEEGTGTIDQAGGPEEIQGSTTEEGGEPIISPSDSSEFDFGGTTGSTSQGVEVVGGEVNMSPGDSSEFDFGGSTGSVEIGAEAGSTGAVLDDNGQGGSWEPVGSEVMPESGPASTAAPAGEIGGIEEVSSPGTGAADVTDAGSWEEVGSEVMPESGPASTAAPGGEQAGPAGEMGGIEEVSSPGTGAADSTGAGSWEEVGSDVMPESGPASTTAPAGDQAGNTTGTGDGSDHDTSGSGGETGGDDEGGDEGGDDDEEENDDTGQDDEGGGEEGMTMEGGSGDEPGNRRGSILGGTVPSGGDTEDAGRQGPILAGGALGSGGGEGSGSDVGINEKQPLSGAIPLHPDSGGAKPIDPVRATAEAQADQQELNDQQLKKTGAG